MWYHYSRSIGRGKEAKGKIFNTKYMPVSTVQKKKKIRALISPSIRITYWPRQQFKCKKIV